MLKLLQTAWTGWRDFTTAGKLPALLLALLLFVWFRSRKERETKTFLLYTTVTTALCILPFTAAFLMLYQTMFYDYEWIWSLVPMTAMIGFGGVLLIEDCSRMLRGKRAWVRGAFLAALCGILVICSGFGLGSSGFSDEAAQRAQAHDIYTYLEKAIPGRHYRIWAPKEILAYSRVGWADCDPLYGRNLWDRHLNAYTYDTYPEELEQLELWIDGDLERGDWTDERCAEYLAGTDVTCIVLPVRLEGAVGTFEEVLGITASLQGEYYIMIR